MLAQISSRQLSEWMAFSELEPFGFDVDMFGHGIVASTLANIYKKKGAKAFKPKDFVPITSKERPTAGAFFSGLKSLFQPKKKD